MIFMIVPNDDDEDDEDDHSVSIQHHVMSVTVVLPLTSGVVLPQLSLRRRPTLRFFFFCPVSVTLHRS